ncbi:MAG: hypothetical protein ACHQX1_00150 [Candidatus Micrarchaeales archaeon]
MGEEKIIGIFRYGAVVSHAKREIVVTSEMVFTESRIFGIIAHPVTLPSESIGQRLKESITEIPGMKEWEETKRATSPSIDYSRQIVTKEMTGIGKGAIGSTMNYKLMIKDVTITKAQSPDELIVMFRGGPLILQSVELHIQAGALDVIRELVLKTPLANILHVEV